MEKVIDLIIEVCNDSKIVTKNPDVDLFETGLLDSMGFLELLTIIEDEYDIEIDPADATKTKLGTPRAICNYVERIISEKEDS